MRALLDTQVYLWYLADSPKLSQDARDTTASAEDVFVSAASIWEAVIKGREKGSGVVFNLTVQPTCLK